MKLRSLNLVFLSFVFVACGNEPIENDNKEEEEKIIQQSSLKDALDAHKSRFKRNPDTAKKAAYARGIQEVAESGIYDHAKNVGDNAPDFELKNASGKKVSLYELLKNGPVVLTWYRGGWCPYCNITLSALQQRLADFKAVGATLVALTPELPDSSLSTKERNELEFEVLSDTDNKVAKEYGIVFSLNNKVAEYYNNGFGLANYNGNTNNELPLAATYVIDTHGVIRYAFLDADYTNRAEPDSLLREVKALK